MRFTLNFTPAALPPFNRFAMRAPPKHQTPLREDGWVQEEQKHIDTVRMAQFLGLLLMFRIFSDDPYINIIFLRTMVNRLFFSPRNLKYILTEPQMAKTFFKSLQRQPRHQTFKFSCNPAVYTDHTGQLNTKYAAICRKSSKDWSSIIRDVIRSLDIRRFESRSEIQIQF